MKALIRPESKIWIGPCVDFIHAFRQWLNISDRENWYIVEDRSSARHRYDQNWLKLSDPLPRRRAKRYGKGYTNKGWRK